jgi:hypothetical protein
MNIYLGATRFHQVLRKVIFNYQIILDNQPDVTAPLKKSNKTPKEVFGCFIVLIQNLSVCLETSRVDSQQLGELEKNISFCLNLKIQIFNFKLKFGGRTTLTSLISSIQKLFKTMNSSLGYDSFKFGLQKLNHIDLEGKCEFKWPHTPSFEVNP